MFPYHRDHHCLLQPVWKWWCTAVLHLQRKKQENTAEQIMDTSFSMLCICGVFLMLIGFLFARPILVVFGASSNASYLCLSLYNDLPDRNYSFHDFHRDESFYQCQGYSTIGMLSVAIGAVANLLLDPVVYLCAWFWSAGALQLLRSYSLRLCPRHLFYSSLQKSRIKSTTFSEKRNLPVYCLCQRYCKPGSAGFIMQLTNSLVTICCNNVLSVTGGDRYIFVMTIVSSVRQLVETPIYAINEGASSNPKLQLRCKTSMPCKKSRCDDGSHGSGSILLLRGA